MPFPELINAYLKVKFHNFITPDFQLKIQNSEVNTLILRKFILVPTPESSYFLATISCYQEADSETCKAHMIGFFAKMAIVK